MGIYKNVSRAYTLHQHHRRDDYDKCICIFITSTPTVARVTMSKVI